MRVTQNGTELDPEISGVSTGDYTVDPDNKKITLKVGATVSDAIVVYYSYLLDIRVEAEVDNNADREKIYTKKYIKSMSEARKIVRKIANYFGENSVRGKLTVPNMDQFANVEPNYKTNAYDSIRGVNQSLTITKVTYEFPKGGLQIEVGKTQYDLFDWSKETQQRIKDLEAQNQNNSIIQRYRYIFENIKVSVTELSVTAQTRTIGDTFIYDHPTNSQWDNNFKYVSISLNN